MCLCVWVRKGYQLFNIFSSCFNDNFWPGIQFLHQLPVSVVCFYLLKCMAAIVMTSWLLKYWSVRVCQEKREGFVCLRTQYLQPGTMRGREYCQEQQSPHHMCAQPYAKLGHRTRRGQSQASEFNKTNWQMNSHLSLSMHSLGGIIREPQSFDLSWN